MAEPWRPAWRCGFQPRHGLGQMARQDAAPPEVAQDLLNKHRTTSGGAASSRAAGWEVRGGSMDSFGRCSISMHPAGGTPAPPERFKFFCGFPDVFPPQGCAEARPSQCALHGEGRASARPQWGSAREGHETMWPSWEGRALPRPCKRGVPGMALKNPVDTARTEPGPPGGPEIFFQSLEKRRKFFPIIGKIAPNFPTIGKKFSNHWKIFWRPGGPRRRGAWDRRRRRFRRGRTRRCLRGSIGASAR